MVETVRLDDRVPGGVLVALLVVGALLVSGALYLIAVRGDALFVDLAGLSGALFCF